MALAEPPDGAAGRPRTWTDAELADEEPVAESLTAVTVKDTWENGRFAKTWLVSFPETLAATPVLDATV